MKELMAIVERLRGAEPRAHHVLATLVTVEGSSYRRPGARLLLAAEGDRIGSISGGCLEEDIRERGRTVAKTGRAQLALYDTTAENDLLWGVGLGCHGIVRVLIERLAPAPEWIVELAARAAQRQTTELAVVFGASDPSLLGTALAARVPVLPAGSSVFRQTIEPPPALHIYGAGDDARPLAQAAKELGWWVAVADPRPAFATADRFPGADLCLAAPAGDLVDRTAPGPEALAMVMTHHYVHDVPILRDLLRRPLVYLGLLGPRKRAEQILADLEAKGEILEDRQRDRLRAPAGLDLGAETPDEVALSILAEMRSVLAGRDGRPLRERVGPIHAKASIVLK
jgi:xanthine dehydrogenase accessory factor